MIKFGVIGYGYWGPNVVRNLQSIAGAEVLSVCDKSSAARRRIHREAALRQFANYPFTGLGMWAAARFGVLPKIGYTQTATIHSDWVEIIVGTGPWGVIPVVVLMAMAWWVLVRATINRNIAIEYRQLAYEEMAVLSVVTARMFFMTDLSLHPPCQFLAALGCAEFVRRKVKQAR